LLTDFPNLKSFWSVSDALFSISALAAAMPVIGICTYIIVFNLNNISSFFKPTWRSDLLQPLFDQQVNGMRHDSNKVWEKTRAASCSMGAPQEGCPSNCRNVHFSVWQLFFNFCFSTMNLRMFAPKALWNRGRGERLEDQLSPVSLRDLGDVRVRVQVDVESCAASQKARNESA
jgi:hypothetical protein